MHTDSIKVKLGYIIVRSKA